MFERYTEAARKVIFFARFEASQFGNATIDPEHLLLGLMRPETKPNQFLTSLNAASSIRQQLESSTPARERLSTSLDLPLNQASKRALHYACEEADALSHRNIDTCHLVLGVLRLETSVAVKLLEQYGVNYTAYRELVRQDPLVLSPQTRPVEPPIEDPAESKEPAAPSLRVPVLALDHLLKQAARNLNSSSEHYARQRLKRKPWSRKEGLGHLINLAAVHHQWLATVLTQPKLTVSGYPDDEWVAAQHYQDYDWPELVDLWISLNRLLIHQLSVIPEAKLNTPCRIGIEAPIPLRDLVARYVRHCENILVQILARL